LSNPNETSFRAFLTERSFRKHLSRIDDPRDDEEEESVTSSSSKSTSHRSNNGAVGSTATAPLHFARSASVAMRTPAHLFRSFVVVAIASVSAAPAPSSTSDKQQQHRPRPRLADTWYVGAFGIWWQVGSIDILGLGAGTASKTRGDTQIPGVLELTSRDQYSDGTEGAFDFFSNRHHVAPI